MSEEKWPVLTMIQRRLLGVLVEKAKTTPDAYPLSANALVTGANQKSNRDPIMSLEQEDVDAGLASLQPLGLVTRITGGRVERWRHNLYDLWRVEKVELAILAELLLRGPQTEGELRQHAARMEPIADLDALRAAVKPLQERGMVRWIGEEGRRGSLVAHAFCDEAEWRAIRERAVLGEASAPAAPAVATSPAVETELRAEVASLRERLDRAEEAIRGLTQSLETLAKSLGG